jgi:hypothetical protein
MKPWDASARGQRVIAPFWPTSVEPGTPQGGVRRRAGSRAGARLLGALATLALASAAAHAQGTRVWTQSTAADWERGTPAAVSIGSLGELRSGPQSRALAETNSTFAWGVIPDGAGGAYVATGSPAAVLHIDSSGKSTRLLKTTDGSVQFVRIGPDGALYAATNPSGAVYRLDPKVGEQDSAKLTPVFDTKSVDGKPKYIWDLTWDSSGRLYVATGASGGVWRVPAGGGKPEAWFATDEPHARSLAWAPGGRDLLVGTEGTGLVYRVGPDGKGPVLYEAGKREITSLAVQGSHLYLSAVGEKGRSNLPPLPVTGQAVVTTTITVIQSGAPAPAGSSGGGAVADGSEVDELDLTPPGRAQHLWTGRDEVVYALAPLPDGGVLAATGNTGRLLQIFPDGSSADLGRADAQQITALASGAPGHWWAATANPGKLLQILPAAAGESSLESDVFDAGVRSQWGRAELTGTGAPELWARSGEIENPLRGWGPWVKLDGDGRAPGAALGTTRYLQWRVVLGSPATRVSSISVHYLPSNVPPVVDEVQVVPGLRSTATPNPVPLPQQVLLTFGGGSGNGAEAPEQGLPALRDKGWVTARWAAHDDNGDRLQFSLLYRREDESTWHPLKDKLTDRWYSWEASLLPDGPYRLKVVASDALNWPEGESLEAERESPTFRISTASPRVEALVAASEPSGLHVTATASGASAAVVRSEYSVDGGDWHWVEPVGRISDSPVEHYDFRIPGPSGPGHSVTLRVWDRADNQGSAVATSR